MAERTTAELVGLLDADSPLEQELARRRLFLRGEEARELIREALGDASALHLKRLLVLLQELGGTEDREAVLPFLDHEHLAVRAEAVRFLARHAPEHPRVLPLLGDPDPAVRHALLQEIERQPFPVQVRWVDQCLPGLASGSLAGDPHLRAAARRLLALSDRTEAAIAMGEAVRQGTAQENDELLTRLAARPPRWQGEAWESLLRDMAQEVPDGTWRMQLLTWDRGPPIEDHWEPVFFLACVTQVLGPREEEIGQWNRPEQEAARAVLARLGPAAGAGLRDLLPGFFEHPGLATGLDLVMKLRGPHSLEDLVQLLGAARDHPNASAEILSFLPRLRSERTANVLERQVESSLPGHLRPAFIECVLRLPDGEARRRMLLNALSDLEEDARVRPFEELAQGTVPSHVGFLVDALLSTRSSPARARMTQLLAEFYGPREPELVLAVLSDLLASNDDSDRRAALSSVPFVALEGELEELARFLVSEFEESEPSRLLLVLSQLGGPVAEETMLRLGRAWQEDPEHSSEYGFLLRQCGRMTGDSSRLVLIEALAGREARTSLLALRSLLQRNDESLFREVGAILPLLDATGRSGLLRELAVWRRHPDLRRIWRPALDQFTDDETRTAILELLAPEHAEEMVPWLLRELGATPSHTFRLVALETLGRMGGSEARRLLTAASDPVIGRTLPDLFELAEGEWEIARTAVLARGREPDSDYANLLVEYLLRQEGVAACRNLWSQRHGDPVTSNPADPELLQVLASLDTQTVQQALQSRAGTLEPLLACLSEGFFRRTAGWLLRAGADPSLVHWWKTQVARHLPGRSGEDFLATAMTQAARHQWLRVPLVTSAAELQQVALLEAAMHDPDLQARDVETVVGREDAFFDWSTQRTLRVMSLLAADSSPRGFSPETLILAAREARRHALLLTTLARLADPVDPVLARSLAERAVEASPYLPYALGTLRGLREAQDPDAAPIPALRDREALAIRSGLVRAHPLVVLEDMARDLALGRSPTPARLQSAVRAAPWVAVLLARDPGLADLRDLMNTEDGR